MANLVVALHRCEAGVQLVACGCVEVCAADLVLHLVLQSLEQRTLFAEDLHLDVHEELEVLVELVGVLVHKLLEGLALDEVGDDSPLAVDFGDFLDLGDIQSRFLNSRLVERLVEDIGLGEGFVKDLDSEVAVAVDDLIFSLGENIVKFHGKAPFRALNRVFVVAVVGVEVHLLDFLEERITRVGACALVVERLLGHLVEGSEEVLLLNAVICDCILDADPCLELVDAVDEVLNALLVVLAAEAEELSDLSIAREGVGVVILGEGTHL